jgi:hypothetical protein
MDSNPFRDCAVVWTKDKVCRRREWQNTQPIPRADDLFERQWAAQIAAGFEPAINLRGSGLVGFEADGDEAWKRLRLALKVSHVKPWIVEGRQAEDGAHVHVYTRMDTTDAPKVSFRFERETIIAASNNYYRVSYDGGPYSVWFVNDDAPNLEPWQYARFLNAHAEADRKRATARKGNPLAEGRHNGIFRFACMLSRWTDDAELAYNLADSWQRGVFEEPVTMSEVEHQVNGAWKLAEKDDRFGVELEDGWTALTRMLKAGRDS